MPCWHTPAHSARHPQRQNTRGKVTATFVGDRIIKAGEVGPPTDSIVIRRTASFDEASLTSEDLPQVKGVGDQLLSGSINLDGPVALKPKLPHDGCR